MSDQTLCWFKPMVVPGLLQTEDYATAIFRTKWGLAITRSVNP